MLTAVDIQHWMDITGSPRLNLVHIQRDGSAIQSAHIKNVNMGEKKTKRDPVM